MNDVNTMDRGKEKEEEGRGGEEGRVKGKRIEGKGGKVQKVTSTIGAPHLGGDTVKW